ncbi:hypothetical protein [Aporhodopirellula aestuarii]|uniref:Helix-turn-helix domain-containing protein n=1 Tax=Aporhodopirellula aestuarii TaxID=2950107 RepID=A0ABT0U235_9BACT|nr:hypothetical protein [Aporhodopirellula aestuarii]MCM2370937.1 hypothetical protein [Aporhodopirellula aestuarii]
MKQDVTYSAEQASVVLKVSPAKVRWLIHRRYLRARRFTTSDDVVIARLELAHFGIAFGVPTGISGGLR